MLDLGQSPADIALFLGIDDGTLYRHLDNYQTKGLDKYLANNYVGYWGKLDSFQLAKLREELNSRMAGKRSGDLSVHQTRVWS